jgi:hypothetical protein
LSFTPPVKDSKVLKTGKFRPRRWRTRGRCRIATRMRRWRMATRILLLSSQQEKEAFLRYIQEGEWPKRRYMNLGGGWPKLRWMNQGDAWPGPKLGLYKGAWRPATTVYQKVQPYW